MTIDAGGGLQLADAAPSDKRCFEKQQYPTYDLTLAQVKAIMLGVVQDAGTDQRVKLGQPVPVRQLRALIAAAIRAEHERLLPERAVYGHTYATAITRQFHDWKAAGLVFVEKMKNPHYFGWGLTQPRILGYVFVTLPE